VSWPFRDQGQNDQTQLSVVEDPSPPAAGAEAAMPPSALALMVAARTPKFFSHETPRVPPTRMMMIMHDSVL
jgi:hypothetical protein